MNFFTQHLKDSNCTYFSHLKFAIYASFLLIYAAVTSLIHAIFPFLFKGSAAYIVIKLYKERLLSHPNPTYQSWIKDSNDDNFTRHNQ